jgi:hypothetical protein
MATYTRYPAFPVFWLWNGTGIVELSFEDVRRYRVTVSVGEEKHCSHFGFERRSMREDMFKSIVSEYIHEQV